MTLDEINYSIKEYSEVLLKIEERKHHWKLHTQHLIRVNLKAILQQVEKFNIKSQISDSEDSLTFRLPDSNNFFGGYIDFVIQENGSVLIKIQEPQDKNDDLFNLERRIIGKKNPEDITAEYVVQVVDRFFKEMITWQSNKVESSQN